jgi:hypothetical protein
MSVVDRLLSAARGAFWIVRGSGLRSQVGEVRREVVTLRDQLHNLPDLREPMVEVRRELVTLRDQLHETHRRDWESAQRQARAAEQHRRWQAARDLRAFERRVFSQNGEDGILEEIFRRIGIETRFFVEFGVESGAQCNCARLAVEEGWRGLFLEADPTDFERLAERYRGQEGVRCARAVVTSANIERLLEENGVPRSFDLLSIDIDGNDYWVWKAIRGWRPRVVVVEYNAAYPPPQRWVMKEDPEYRWNGTTYYGASLASLAALGREKGYALVGTNSSGVNAFFVLAELATADRFPDPVSQYHYSPPSYGAHDGTHPPGSGPHLEL